MDPVSQELMDHRHTNSPVAAGGLTEEHDTQSRFQTAAGQTKLRTRSVHFADANQEKHNGSGDRIRDSEENLQSNSHHIDYSNDFFTTEFLTPLPAPGPLVIASERNQEDDTVEHVVNQTKIEQPVQPPFIAYLSPLYINNRTVKANLVQTTYIPSAAPAPLASQFESSRPVFKEDDGLYVGQRPAVSHTNQNTMENRVVTEKALHWIDQDWKIKALPDPVNLLGSRCHVDHERDQENNLIAVSAPLLENVDVVGKHAPKRLEMTLDFIGIEFQHHYLFSLEHVYAAKLKDVFDGHVALLQENVAGQLTERIGGLKIHLESLKQSLEIAVTDELRMNLQICIRDLLMTRLKRDDAFRREQLSLIDLVAVWTQLKQLRLKNGFTSTPYQLVLQAKQPDHNQDLDNHQQAIEDELDEREILHALQLPELNEQYQKEFSQWQDRQVKWEAAQREVDAAIRENRSVVGDGVAHLAAQHQPSRPDPAAAFQRREQLRLIEERLTHSRRRPGDPVYIPNLKTDLPLTDTVVCPANERSRRSDVAGQHLFLRVVMNDREVCRSISRVLRSDFSVAVGKTFTVFVEFVPASIKVEIFEETGFRNRKLAETFIPVPDETSVFDGVDEEAIEFSSPEKVAPVHNAVGSGIPILVDGNDAAVHAETRYTTGTVRCRAAWSSASANQIAAMSRLSRENSTTLFGPRGVRDIKKLCEWVQAAKLDPNDPNYAELIHFVNNFEHAPEIKYFRLEQLQQEFDFCTLEDIAANRRFQVLQLRERQVTDFADLKMVPANADEISALMLTEHRKRMRHEASSVMNAGNSKRQQYTRMLQKLREYISTTVYAAESVHTYEDLVNEEPILTFGKFFAVLTQFWKPKQHLKPIRKRRKTVSVKQMGMVEMQLVVRIIGATFLPIRQEAGKKAATDAANTQRLNVLPGSSVATALQIPIKKQDPAPVVLQPFVIVRFAGQEKRLPVANGPNPVWNEQLSFWISPSAKSSLQFLKQELEIHFYDQVSVDVLQDDMLRKTHVFQRLDRPWLGSVSFSFTDLYIDSVIEGAFPLNSPPVLLGYTQPPTASQDPSPERPTPQASVFITLDPPLTPPVPLAISKLESTETDAVAENAAAWTAALRKHFPDRPFQPMVINTEAKSCLVTRFIRPLTLPPGLVVESAPVLDKMTNLAKYVARIPYVSDTLLFPEAVDIWTTNDQFLNLQCGDDEEHALLLLSYFLEMKVSAYLMLGNRVTGGSGTYVLSKLNDDWQIWDATSGCPYKPNSINCPLKDIGILVDATNIWANIQIDGTPRQLQWVVTNSVNWKPFWPAKQTTAPELVSAQPESFTYDEVPFGFKQELEILIKNKIVTKVMDERGQYITRWNIECDRRLYALLSTMEQQSPGNMDIQKEHERELRDLLRIYEIYGFPLNISFSNNEDVVSAILATGIHKIDSNDVELSLAVHVTTYPHSVISLWVYFVVLLKRP